MREIARIKADLGHNLWHPTQQIKRLAVGFLLLNPETVERHDGVVGEAPTPFGGGGFASATNSIFSQRHRFAREAGDLRHRSSPISRFTSFDLTTYPAALQRFTKANSGW